MTVDGLRELLAKVESGQLRPEEAKQALEQLRDGPAGPTPVAAPGVESRPVSSGGVAVIGMACRFGGADNVEEYWELLKNGGSTVGVVPPTRWDVEKYFDPDPQTPNRTNSKWGSFLTDIAGFDPLFFQLSGLEAERMDPQQRLVLETSWTALEQAGWVDGAAGSSCGVFMGTPGSDYVVDDQRHGVRADAQTMMGNDSAILAARISYLLDLRGPSIALNTACSSSLVAMDLAIDSIRSGSCEMALAGGVCVFITPGFYISASKAGMLSPSGRCSTFDQAADGFVPGEGVGVLVLKDLDKAIADGDTVRAVILGSSTNQDGRSNGITAPSSGAQTDLQLDLYRRNGIDPGSIEMLEAHGTGTPLGDPIEVEALTRSFRSYTADRQFCAIGSAKSNIGHTGQAAGVAGVIKCILALEANVIPPTINFTSPNERIDFAQSPFYVADKPVAWETSGRGQPRRAAVSSYGYSGTNAHIVLEEAPQVRARHSEAGPNLFVISAATDEALQVLLQRIAEYVRSRMVVDADSLADLAYTLLVGRRHRSHRAALVVSTNEQLLDGLAQLIGQPTVPVRPRPVGQRRQLDTAFASALETSSDRATVLGALRTAFLDGYVPQADMLFGSDRRRIPAPTYPFEHSSYWLGWVDSDHGDHRNKATDGTDAASEQSNSTVLGSVSASMATITEAEAETEHGVEGVEQYRGFTVDVNPDHPHLDHLVAGERIVAAMVTADLVSDAAGKLGIANPQLEDVIWHRPLRADDVSLAIRFFADNGRHRFEIAPSGGRWVPTASGFVAEQGCAAEVPGLDHEMDSARRHMTRSEIYDRLRAVGIGHGPAFQRLTGLETDGKTVRASVEVESDRDRSRGQTPSAPLLDSAIQAMIGLGGTDGALRVPYTLGRLRTFGTDDVASEIRIVSTGDEHFDIDMIDASGSLVAEIVGLRAVAVAVAVPPAAAGATTTSQEIQSADTGLWQLEWSELEDDSCSDLLVGDPDPLVGLSAGSMFVAPEAVILRPDQRGGVQLDQGPWCDLATVEGWGQIMTELGSRPGHLVLWMGEASRSVANPSHSEALTPSHELTMAVSLMRSIDPSATDRTRPMRVTVAYPARAPGVSPWLEALAAFGRSLGLERPFVKLSTLGCDDRNLSTSMLLAFARQVGSEPASPLANRRELMIDPEGRLMGRRIRPYEVEATTELAGKTYLVSGGAGGVGRRIVQWLIDGGANVAIIGRSSEERVADWLAQIRSSDRAVSYHQADVADRDSMRSIVTTVTAANNGIHGVIHAAGATNDGLIGTKTAESMSEVVGPKARGAVVLDEVTADQPLECFLLLSSAVSWVGNIGQTDYGYANGVLDALAVRRSQMRDLGMRSGRSVAMAFSGWAGSGMADSVAHDGLSLLSTTDGLRLLAAGLGSDYPNLLALKGKPDEIHAVLDAVVEFQSSGASPGGSDSRMSVGATEIEQAVDVLLDTFADELRLSRDRIDPERPLEDYGIDSVMINRLSVRLESIIGPIPRTLFFEYQTIAELAEYVAIHHPGIGAVPQTTDESSAPVVAVDRPLADHGRVENLGPDVASGSNSDRQEPKVAIGEPLAIIGLAGQFPKAGNLTDFWDNLAAGADCVVEIPEDRWSLDQFYDPTPGPHRSYSKWGGFIDGVKRFDPVFFGISPNEARMMDPQERLFLQTVWHVLEHAGYSRESLRGSRTGVYAAAMYGQYQLLGSDAEGRIATSSYASIANRVSYFFDWRGPSLCLDSMCSSSLVALHSARRAIQAGDCDTAIVGGTNLSVHPGKYLQLSVGRFASSDGRCHSFGQGGDGYVPGEGVSALLLKPLSKAESDGDTIHAVVRGSAINHGGKTNGYTVPNLRQQTSVVEAAMADAGVDPSDIDYVEAHGTGTALGDPIEVEALRRVYSNQPVGSLPIGSVKSNIGHLEAAAGMAAIAKVILQMQHQTIVPTLHSEPPNEAIDFASSPFRVPAQIEQWPVGKGKTAMAAISSFGAGGTNAHVVLQAGPAPDRQPAVQESSGSELLVISAQSEKSLRTLAARLAGHLRTEDSRPAWSEVADELVALTATILGLESLDIDPSVELGEIGFDGVNRQQLVDAVAARFGCVVNIDGQDCLASIADRIGDRGPGRESSTRSEGGDLLLADIGYTLRNGRSHLDYRAALVVNTHSDAVNALLAVAEGRDGPQIYLGRRPDRQAGGGRSEAVPSTEDVGDQVGRAIADRNAELIGRLWVGGAAVDWGMWDRTPGRRVPLVEYPFDGEEYWIESTLEQRSPSSDEAAATPTQGQVTRSTALPIDQIELAIADMAAELIGLDRSQFDVSKSLLEYGFESVNLKELSLRISERFGVNFGPDIFFDHATLSAIADWVQANADADVGTQPLTSGSESTVASAITSTFNDFVVADPLIDDELNGAVAIIGMSGRFPGSPDLDAYWRNLELVHDVIEEVPANRWDWREVESEAGFSEDYRPFQWGGFLSGVDEFDPGFFGISPAEAEMMDPQQRLLLSYAWTALENAGHRPSSLRGSNTGVFMGIQFSDYQHLLHASGVLNAHGALGNEHSIAANRISYLLGLHGPSEPINTACSSSLVAMHRAIRSLRSGESDLALAGGIALNLAPYSTKAAGMMRLLSPDGRCKTLDARANGYVKGEGVGVIVLKPYRRAIADGDSIHAVIRGSAVNHGGRAASITAPNAEAQSELIRAALHDAGLSPEQISYVELHGTGTELGDPIEIRGLTKAFATADSSQTKPWCGIGSVKTNIGHLEPASGIAGLIKVVLSMKNRALPGTAHLETVNPYISLDGSPFHVVTETGRWVPPPGGRLRAGVSSFGFGGVNAHVIVEEGPVEPQSESGPADGPYLFAFSARTRDSLRRTAAAYVEHLDSLERSGLGQRPADVAYTLQVGRDAMTERMVIVASSLAALGRSLAAFDVDGDRMLVADDAYVDGAPTGQGRAADLVNRAQAWLGGDELSPVESNGDRVLRRVPLPTYRFDTKRYWFDQPAGPSPEAKVVGRSLPAGQPVVSELSGEEDGSAEIGSSDERVLTPQASTNGGLANSGMADGGHQIGGSDEDHARLVRQNVVRLLASKLKMDASELGLDQDLSTFGIDSMFGASIMQAMLEEFDVQLNLNALVEYSTIRALGDYIASELDPQEVGLMSDQTAIVTPKRRRLPDELIPVSTTGDQIPSFWVHGAPGYSTWFRNLSMKLGPDYPIYAFQARGTDGRSLPQRFDEMVDHYLDCLFAVRPSGPYILGGYSFGGLVAMDMARKIDEAGHKVSHLIMLDTYPATDEVFERHLGIYADGFLQMYLANYFLKIEEFPERTLTMADLEGIPQSLHLAELARMTAERADSRLSDDDIFAYLRGGILCSEHAEGNYVSYEMRDYAASDVLFFRAADGFTGKASEAYWKPLDILSGYDYVEPWKAKVVRNLTSVDLDTDHMNMLEGNSLSTVAQHVQPIIDQATRNFQRISTSIDE